MDLELTQYDNDAARGSPRTLTVLVFLAAFAVMTSYLAIYAGTNALIAADMMKAWPIEADPRPRWMLNAFVVVFSVGAVGGLFFRFISNRQLRRIDAMAEAD